jgi:hypothetical protein
MGIYIYVCVREREKGDASFHNELRGKKKHDG